MELHTGTDRRVISGRRYTAKIARTNPSNVLKSAVHIYKLKGIGVVIDTWRQESPDGYAGLKWNLLHGIVANRREARLARTTDVVVPTVSFLAGIINIQSTTQPITASGEEVLRTFSKNLDNQNIKLRLGHMLEDPENFGVHDGTVKFRDGGSAGFEQVISSNEGTSSIKKVLGALTVNYS